MQYHRYFTSFSCFYDLFYDLLCELNNNNIWRFVKYLSISHEATVRELAYRETLNINTGIIQSHKHFWWTYTPGMVRLYSEGLYTEPLMCPEFFTPVKRSVNFSRFIINNTPPYIGNNFCGSILMNLYTGGLIFSGGRGGDIFGVLRYH